MNSNVENQKDLEYFKKLQYEVVVKRRKGGFIVFIPELSIIEKDESLEKAYEKLELKKEKYFQEMIENGYQDHIKEPEGRKIGKTRISDLTNYLLKLAITVVVIIFLGVVGMKVASYGVKHQTRSIVDIFNQIKQQKRSYVNNAPEIILRELRNVANRLIYEINNMPDEKREKIRIELRKTVKQIKPFLDEFKPLFKDILTEGPEQESSF